MQYFCHGLLDLAQPLTLSQTMKTATVSKAVVLAAGRGTRMKELT